MPRLKSKRTRGQPEKIDNPELRETIINFIKAGNYIQTACEAAGIHPSTYCLWRQRAEQAEIEGKKDKYSEFFNAIKKAEKEAEAFLVANIKNAAVKKGAWQAAAFLLERKYPAQWGRKDMQKQEHSGTIAVEYQKLTDEQLEERLLSMQGKLEKVLAQDAIKKETDE